MFIGVGLQGIQKAQITSVGVNKTRLCFISSYDKCRLNNQRHPMMRWSLKTNKLRGQEAQV